MLRNWSTVFVLQSKTYMLRNWGTVFVLQSKTYLLRNWSTVFVLQSKTYLLAKIDFGGGFYRYVTANATWHIK